MIDLHLHTTASDGRRTPEQLVEEAAAAGLTTIAVTDHDTVAATADVAALCAARGLASVNGIEITAIENGRDVHILGYLFDTAHAGFMAFLTRQRQERFERVMAISARLASLGLTIESLEILKTAKETGRSIGRPHVARAMVQAGHVADTREAFDKWLGRGQPAFVPRAGATSSQVIDIIHAARGIASLAHPGQTAIDARIPELRAAGLDALEAYHSDHTPQDRDRYLRMASDLHMLITGGSDYHGDPQRGVLLGSVALPQSAWERLVAHHADLPA